MSVPEAKPVPKVNSLPNGGTSPLFQFPGAVQSVVGPKIGALPTHVSLAARAKQAGNESDNRSKPAARRVRRFELNDFTISPANTQNTHKVAFVLQEYTEVRRKITSPAAA